MAFVDRLAVLWLAFVQLVLYWGFLPEKGIFDVLLFDFSVSGVRAMFILVGIPWLFLRLCAWVIHV